MWLGGWMGRATGCSGREGPNWLLMVLWVPCLGLPGDRVGERSPPFATAHQHTKASATWQVEKTSTVYDYPLDSVILEFPIIKAVQCSVVGFQPDISGWNHLSPSLHLAARRAGAGVDVHG